MQTDQDLPGTGRTRSRLKNHSAEAAFQRLDLLAFLVASRLKPTTRQVVLGYLWWILDPLLLMLVYWLLVRVIFGKGSPDYPFFLICTLVPWRAFSVSLNQSVVCLSSRFNLLGAFSFPRIFLPLADVIANHVKLAVGMLVPLVFGLHYGYPPGRQTFLVVGVIGLQLLAACGLAMILSVAGAYVHELKNLVPFLLRLWIYLSPVLFSFRQVPEKWCWLILVNPIAPALELFRQVLMPSQALDWRLFGLQAFHSFVLLGAGWVVFRANEKKILKLL